MPVQSAVVAAAQFPQPPPQNLRSGSCCVRLRTTRRRSGLLPFDSIACRDPPTVYGLRNWFPSPCCSNTRAMGSRKLSPECCRWSTTQATGMSIRHGRTTRCRCPCRSAVTFQVSPLNGLVDQVVVLPAAAERLVECDEINRECGPTLDQRVLCGIQRSLCVQDIKKIAQALGISSHRYACGFFLLFDLFFQ